MAYDAATNRYDGAKFRRTGNSGLMLPLLSLGLWHNFGDSTPIDRQRAMLRAAFDRGVMHFDLANNYGPPYGAAEEHFGTIFAQDFRPYRDELIISTKAGWDMWPGPYGDHGSRKYLLASLDASLRRMGLDYVDIFYHHRPDPATPIEETASALATAVNSGKALYAGISSYDAAQTKAMVAALKPYNIHLLIHQPPYNMFNREIEAEVLPTLEKEGIGAIVFVPLAQGLLTDRYLSGNIPPMSRAATSPTLSAGSISETYLERVRVLNAIAQKRGQSLAQLALSWILRDPRITSALVGASSPAQLEQNVAAVTAPPLTDAELGEIAPLATPLPNEGS